MNKQNETLEGIKLEITDTCEIEKTNEDERFREMISFLYEGKRADIVATIMNDETIKAYNMDGDFYYTEENSANKEKVPEAILNEMLNTAKYQVVSDYENIAQYKQEQDIFFDLYKTFNDDNDKHCEEAFANNGLYEATAQELHDHNIEFVKEIISYGYSEEEILALYPNAERYLNEINEEAAYEKEMDNYVKIYMNFNDDNIEHCESSFISNGLYNVSAEELHQQNIDFLKEVMKCHVSGDEIVAVCPELIDYIKEINEEAAYKQEQDIFFDLYKTFNDDNDKHCEEAFANNGLYEVTAQELHDHNVEFIQEIISHGFTPDDIIKACPQVAEHLTEIDYNNAYTLDEDIVSVLNDNNISVSEQSEDGSVSLEWYTPMGCGFCFDISAPDRESFIENFDEYANNFDEDEYIDLYADSPVTYRELLSEAESIKEHLSQVSSELSEIGKEKSKKIAIDK